MLLWPVLVIAIDNKRSMLDDALELPETRFSKISTLKKTITSTITVGLRQTEHEHEEADIYRQL